MNCSKIFFVLLISSASFLTAQTDSIKTQEYMLGLAALKNKDTTKAIDFFKESTKYNKDAASYFKVAELYSVNQTHTNLTNALQYLEKAIEKEPNNIQFKLLSAKIRENLFYLSKINIEERQEAIIEYKEILIIDPANATALNNLGRLNSEDFSIVHNAEAKGGSVNAALSPNQSLSRFRGTSSLAYDKQNEFNNTRGNFPVSSYESKAQLIFDDAEKYLLDALKYNPKSENILIELSRLYIYNNLYEKGITAWNTFKSNSTLKKDSRLYRGILYYSTIQFDKAAREFDEAISLMTEQEQIDFTVNSARILFDKIFDSKIESFSKEEQSRYIEQFWKIRDPLNLTRENERLLEHYYRVAYSNFFFGNERINLIGWKTDRGEILIRYGQPLNKVRYMLEIDNLNSRTPRTEVWNYGDKSFAFVDPIANNNYQFAQPWNSMVPMNTHDDVINLRQTKPEDYNPTFAGPAFNIPYQTYQFRSLKKSSSDVYISFSINPTDSFTLKEAFDDGYQIGIFFFDKYFNKKIDSRNTFKAFNNSGVVTNSLVMTTFPDSGSFAFELMRRKDKGVASYHGKFTVKNFLGNNLKTSDVVLASDVQTDKQLTGAIQRSNYSILPNPTKSFSKNAPLFLYYETYNLKKGQNNITDFEQKITIQRKEEGGILNDILDAVGIDSKGKKITLTTKYQTNESDPQIYLQLDMNKYNSGNYIITISVKDNLTGNEAGSQTEIIWN